MRKVRFLSRGSYSFLLIFIFLFILFIIKAPMIYVAQNFSNIFGIVFNMGVLFIFVFPIGYLLFHLSENEIFHSQNIFVRLPIYLTMGFSGGAIILFALFQIIINKYVLLLIFGICLLFSFVKKNISYKFNRSIYNKHARALQYNLTKIEYILPFSLFLFSFLISVRNVYVMEWAPPGDAITHGMFVSLYLYHQKIVYNLAPILDINIWYPTYGYHGLGTATSLLTGTYPGRAILIFAACITTLLVPILYSTVYAKTKSVFFSLVASLMAFIAPEGHIDTFFNFGFFSRFYGGGYTSLFGKLLVILMLYLIICLDDNSLYFNLKHKVILFFVVITSIMISYPYYILPISLFLLFKLFISINIRNNFSFIKSFITHNWYIFVLIFFVLFYVIFYRLGANLWEILADIIITRKLFASKRLIGGHLKTVDFIDILFYNINGNIVLIASLMSAISLLKKKSRCINMFFASFFIPVLLITINPESHVNFLWMINPYKHMLCSMAVAYIILVISLHDLVIVTKLKKIKITIKSQSPILRLIISKFNPHKKQLVTYFLVFALFSPSISTHITYKFGSWKIRGKMLTDDFETLIWMSENIPSTDILLNDRSFSGEWILSFSIKNVINMRFRSRAESNQIFDNPANYSLARDLIMKYNISYIFVSSSNLYYDRDSESYQRRWPRTSSEYIQMFDNNIYLKAVYRTGNSGVYETFLNYDSGNSTNP